MAIPAQPSSFVVLGVGALIAWRVYARVKRLVGRQRLSPIRPWITLVVFLLLGVLLLGARIGDPVSSGALVGGLIIGALLGGYGTRLTRFEVTGVGVYYTPNLHLGIGLSILFVGRLVFRLVQIYLAGGQWQGLMRGPFTSLLFGVMAGYYILYAVGLLRWRKPVSGSAGDGPDGS